jgi:tRNA A-37 threonylcarbamoyl transferase component Bud32
MNDALERLRTALADHYAVERELGAGGMATVYLAEDIKHRRRVAVKVLKPELAAILGAERFLKEIEVTANLQHPNLLPLFDSGGAAGQLYYVMPHVEGETLRDTLRREKQLPIDVSVRYAVQVASALDYAHRHGVIHRDIKPENVLLHEGQALVADFGIALALRNAGASRLTETGLSLGTPQYMSPEQAMGDREIDARSDVYSLGAMLYEMLAGDPPYTGSTAQAIVAKVITEKAPSVSGARDTVPPHVAAAVARALAKLPADRFRTAAEFAEALQRPGAGGDAPAVASSAARARPARRARLAWAAGGVALFALGGLVTALARPRAATTAGPSVHAILELPDDARVEAPSLSFSGDGRTLWMNVRQGGVERIVSRRLDAPAFTALAGSDDALQLFASPDGRWVAYRSRAGGLLRLPTGGGVADAIDADAAWGYGDWGSDGALYYSRSYNTGLWRVRAETRKPEMLSNADTARGELAHWHPQLLPDGRHVLFTAFRTPIDSARIEVLSLDDGTRTVVQAGAVSGRYVPSGHLLFGRRGVLYAVAFDLAGLRTRGTPTPVVEDMAMRYSDGAAHFAVSANGTLAYLAGSDVNAATALVWVDRTGRVTPALDISAVLEEPSLSPDGRFVAFSRTERGESPDVWVLELARGALTRITSGGASDFNPIWTPDGRRLVYTVESPVFDLWSRDATGGAPAEPVLRSPFDKYPSGFTPDGSQLLFEHAVNPRAQVWRMTLADRRAEKVLEGSREVVDARVSPDGRWIAYQSAESGRSEVYVTSWPTPGRRQLVSVNGGTGARWTKGGRELVFRSGRQMLAVSVDPQSGEPGKPAVLFEADMLYSWARSPNYDVTPDGSRFLMVRRSGPRRAERVHVITNWFDELRSKVP